MKKNPKKREPSVLALVRCAVYTRESTEEGLEQKFNSLDAQREAGEAFIRSQAGEGWTCLPERYDDGGFTGGNMDRPALRRLMGDIEAGRIDAVVCYKVDRLSRSLLDFAKMMATFEQHRVSFVSVTQQFNTATSMGRLVLNVLLSFAQFEREIIAERTRDKIAATRRKGKWAGGHPLLGYYVDPRGFQLVSWMTTCHVYSRQRADCYLLKFLISCAIRLQANLVGYRIPRAAMVGIGVWLTPLQRKNAARSCKRYAEQIRDRSSC